MRCQLRIGGLEELHRIYKRSMRRDFHRYERMPEWMLAEAIVRGVQELLILSDESGMDVGYMICAQKTLYGYVLVNYLAIFEEYRDAGYGAQALHLAADYYGDRQGILVELTDTPGEEEDTQRRRRFYSRSGFEPVPCAYKLGGVRTYLMVLPLQGTAAISGIAHLMIPEIYRHTMPEKIVNRFIEISRLEIFKE